MLLLTHILIASFSLIYSLSLLFMPSLKKIKYLYVTTSVTIISGLFLFIENNLSFGRLCFSGFLYIGIISICLKYGKRSLSLHQ